MMLIKPAKTSVIQGVSLSPSFEELKQYDFIATIGYDDHSISIYDYAWPIHQAHDAPGTFYVTTGRIETGDRSFGLDRPSQWGECCTWEQLREMHNSETGAITVENHTHSHPTLGSQTATQLHEQFNTSQEIFLREGFKPRFMSYPYGNTSVLARQYATAHFDYARGAGNGGQNDSSTDPFYGMAIGIDTTPVSGVKSLIDNARSSGKWIDLYMHAVFPNGKTDADTNCKSPEQLDEIMQYIKDSNGVIVNLETAVDVYMRHTAWSQKELFKANI